MKKGLIWLFALNILIANAQNQNNEDNANADSTSITAGGNMVNMIASPPSDPNNAVIAPMFCPTQNVSWVVGPATCTGTATSANPNTTRNVIATGANSGSSIYTCDAITNTFTGPSAGATCVIPIPPPPPPPPQPPLPTPSEVSDPQPFVSPDPISETSTTCVLPVNTRPQFCGTKTWIVPAGVTSISAIAIGGGGAGATVADLGSQAGGGGGASSYSNNIPVNENDVITINVGCGGESFPTAENGGQSVGPGGGGVNGEAGGDSFIQRNGLTILLAKGGGGGICAKFGTPCPGQTTLPSPSATNGGDASEGIGQTRYSGGDSRLGTASDTSDARPGGGGAGGYLGNGGRGSRESHVVGDPAMSPKRAQPGTGGAGGGGSSELYGGGGTGVFGIGASGQGHPVGTPINSINNGGSGGDTGGRRNAPYCSASNGGYPGGGGSGDNGNTNIIGNVNGVVTKGGSVKRGWAGYGAHGAVRIVFPGDTRQFPSTNVGP